MLIRHVQRASLILTALVAAIFFFIGGAALRLTMGPISFGAFSRPIEDALNRSISGAVIRFDDVVLEWSRPDQKINVIVLGTKIFDSGGHIIAQAPKADLDFDALALLSGHVRLKNFGLIGLQLTGMRTQDGTFRLGFGRDQSEANFLDTLREFLRNSSSGDRALEAVSLQHARVAFLDEPSGIFIVLPDAAFALKTNRGGFDASLNAAAEISGSPFRIAAHAQLNEDGMPKTGGVSIAGFSLRSLSGKNPQFAKLKSYALTGDASAELAFDSTGAVTTMQFHAMGGGSIDAAVTGEALRLSRFDVRGGIDPQNRRVTAQNISLESSAGSFRGKGAFAFDWADGGIVKLSGDFSADILKLNLTRAYTQPLAISQLALHLDYNHDTRQISWHDARFTLGPVTGNLAGSVQLGDGAQQISLNGTLGALRINDLLRYWPNTVAEGARDWITANVPDGQIGPLRIDATLPAGAFDAPALPDAALNVVFPFQNLTVHYVAGMTPITAASGTATLTGDGFHLQVVRGSIGPLALSAGDVTIPDLHISGTTAHILAHADGTTADILRLIDQPPLGYPKRFGIVPGTVEGRSAVDLQFDLPLLKNLGWDQVRFAISANATQLGLPIAQRKLDDAAVRFSVTPSSLTAKGNGRFAAVPVDFQWTEDFDNAVKSTRLDVTGKADDAERTRLGVATPDWITGEIPFTVTLNGAHFHFTDGVLKTDLTQVTADFPGLATSKPAGVPATGNSQLSFDSAGVISMPDFVVTGENLSIRGALMMAEGGKLRSLSLSQFHAGQDDFALTLIPANRGLTVSIQGQALDVRHLTGLDRPTPEAADHEGSTLQESLSVTARVQRLMISKRATLRDVAMSIALGAGNRLNALDLQGSGPAGEKLNGHMSLVKGLRTLDFESDNGGSLIESVLNFSSIRGGKLAVRVTFPERNAAARGKFAPPDYEGDLTLSNVILTNQPFLARLFAAGSLDGPLRLLQGQGISLDKVDIPFNSAGRIITIAEGRASGSAIGGTFTGSYNRDTQKVDISGTLVPLFGLNSVLGQIPVLGDLLVSKKGEGIVGLTYEMKGDIAEPGIMVNPLSLLTPGILRRIFEFGPSRGAKLSSAPAPKPN
jgi:uncharacterized protein DUF3971/AsmA-like protein